MRRSQAKRAYLATLIWTGCTRRCDTLQADHGLRACQKTWGQSSFSHAYKSMLLANFSGSKLSSPSHFLRCPAVYLPSPISLRSYSSYFQSTMARQSQSSSKTQPKASSTTQNRPIAVPHPRSGLHRHQTTSAMTHLSQPAAGILLPLSESLTCTSCIPGSLSHTDCKERNNRHHRIQEAINAFAKELSQGQSSCPSSPSSASYTQPQLTHNPSTASSLNVEVSSHTSTPNANLDDGDLQLPEARGHLTTALYHSDQAQDLLAVGALFA